MRQAQVNTGSTPSDGVDRLEPVAPEEAAQAISYGEAVRCAVSALRRGDTGDVEAAVSDLVYLGARTADVVNGHLVVEGKQPNGLAWTVSLDTWEYRWSPAFAAGRLSRELRAAVRP